MMGTFAGLALVLAMVGVFGVTAYTVAQRTHEIGIHMALGAKKGEVLKMVVRKGMVLGAFGIGIGSLLAAPLIWLRMIPEERAMPVDQRAFVFFTAVFLLSVAALVASYLPARRATRVDPIAALRYE
jgi:ABC-type antimicrobial peptide transport system permease subunit